MSLYQQIVASVGGALVTWALVMAFAPERSSRSNANLQTTAGVVVFLGMLGLLGAITAVL